MFPIRPIAYNVYWVEHRPSGPLFITFISMRRRPKFVNRESKKKTFFYKLLMANDLVST